MADTDVNEFTSELGAGVLTGGDKPSVVYRIVALELQEEDIAEEFKGKLNAAFETTGISTYIGTA
mgnify:CR=1 FL=1